MSIGGVAFAVLLSLLVASLHRGWSEASDLSERRRDHPHHGAVGTGEDHVAHDGRGLLRPTAGRSRSTESTSPGSTDGSTLASGARRFGYVFQSFNLLETLTPRENVEVALNVAGVTSRAVHERAAELLVAAGLGDRLDFRTRDLPGGEKQRVSIARALANRSRLLLADEPTADLDSQHGRSCISCADSLKRRLRRPRRLARPPARGDRRQSAVPGGRANPGRRRRL